MANIKSTWTPESLVAHAQQCARDVAERRAKHGPRQPLKSLWALGVAHGLDLLENSPAEVQGVRELAGEIADAEFRYSPGENGPAALAVHERKAQYYAGLQFALDHGRKAARFYARAAPAMGEILPSEKSF